MKYKLEARHVLRIEYHNRPLTSLLSHRTDYIGPFDYDTTFQVFQGETPKVKIRVRANSSK